MPLKGNKRSVGPPKGIAAVSGPLGIMSKKQAWQQVRRFLNAVDINRQPIFTDEEKQATYAKNTGLNAQEIAGILKFVKRKWKRRERARIKAFYLNKSPNERP